MNEIYRFKIDGPYRPSTLPMERLADYMAALAKLLGEGAHVHFEDVEDGSAVLRARVEEVAQPKVAERVEAVRDARAPDDAVKAYAALDELLRQDNASGNLAGDSATIIPFPGRLNPPPQNYGPFRREGHLDGQLIRVGGKPPTVPVHLLDGDVMRTGLHTTPDVAKRIARFIYGPIIRVHGVGSWLRASTGIWELKNFQIAEFEELDQRGLLEVVSELRDIGERSWRVGEDRYDTVVSLRENGRD